MSRQIPRFPATVIGAIGALIVTLLGLSSSGKAAPQQMNNSVTANGTFVANGDTYTFHFVASETGGGAGNVLYTLVGPHLSICSVLAPDLVPGPNTPRPVFSETHCDIAVHQQVSISDVACRDVRAEVHTFTHSVFPLVNFAGGATTDVRITNTGNRDEAEFTVYTAKRNFTLKGPITEFTAFDCQ